MSTPYDGTDLSDVLASATSLRPALGSDLDEVATRGVQHLLDLVSAAETMDTDDANALVADHLADNAWRQDVGIAAVRQGPAVDASVLRLKGKVSHDALLALKRMIKDELPLAKGKVLEHEAQVGATAIVHMLRKAGLQPPKGLKAPFGYEINESGVLVGDTQVLNRPVVILGYLQDIDSDEVQVRLVWTTPARRWVEAEVPRTAVDDSRKLKHHAPMFPITADGRMLAAYLAAFEDVNGPSLPVGKVTGRMGWASRAFITQHAQSKEDAP